jgi:hypothetical protein
MQRSNQGDLRDKRRPVPFRSGLERSLSAYATAAAAAGVGLLALKSSAEAKIVYTPAHTTIPVNGVPVSLDLNHDGVTDFLFSHVFWVGSGTSFLSGVRAGASNPGNAMWGRGVFNGGWVSYQRNCPSGFAAALPAGFRVRPNNSYLPKTACWVMAWRGAATGGGFSPSPTTVGQWMYTQHRYLGLKFMIGNEVHYGWARFSVILQDGRIQATLTGYAYETIANKPIIAGKIKGPDVITLEPTTLGRLAQGASGMSAWREKK